MNICDENISRPIDHRKEAEGNYNRVLKLKLQRANIKRNRQDKNGHPVG